MLPVTPRRRPPRRPYARVQYLLLGLVSPLLHSQKAKLKSFMLLAVTDTFVPPVLLQLQIAFTAVGFFWIILLHSRVPSIDAEEPSAFIDVSDIIAEAGEVCTGLSFTQGLN